MTRYRFRLPIGDWSGDGHSVCKWFTVESNKPVEDVREAHFKSREILDVESIFSEYGESSLDETQLASLPEWARDLYDEEEGALDDGPSSMAELWIRVLNLADPELELRIVDGIPALTFFGYDEKKRNIGYVGYGLFY